MLRKISINHFITAVVVSFLALFGLLILLPNNLKAEQKKYQKTAGTFELSKRGPTFKAQCIKLLDSRIFKTEKLSMEVENDPQGCIKEESVVFFRSTDCSGEGQRPTFRDLDDSFVYKSGLDGGCADAIEAKHGSPACITLTLKSGRQTTICY